MDSSEDFRGPHRPAPVMLAPAIPVAPGSRGALSKALIVGTAVDLAREEGLRAVTMRRIAANLGVEAMSPYHYIPTKATLLVMMADWSLSRVFPPDSELPWQDQLVELLVQTYLAGVENPVLFEVIASQPIAEHLVPAAGPDTGAASTAFFNLVLTLLARSALPLRRQVDAYRGLIGMLIGFIVVRSDGFLTSPPNHRAPRRSAGDRGLGRPAATALLSKRASQACRLIKQTDPADALRSSAQWFLNGLLHADAATGD